MWTVDQTGPVMPLAPNLRRVEREDALRECARREVTSLYLERAAEFRNYAISLVHDEELALDALQEAFMRYFAALCAGTRIHAPRAVYRVMHNYLSDRQKEYRVRNETSIDYIPKIFPPASAGRRIRKGSVFSMSCGISSARR
jgi:DNA-directed RNA polymerase specialized sigma24 family protein